MEMDLKIIKKFAKFCQKKMGIKTLPNIKLTQSRDEIKTTAGYKRGKEIIIYTKGRHKVDVCRSLAHELKHHKQWEDKEFTDTEKIQDVGGKFEDEANAIAGEMIKQFAYAGNMNIYESKQIITEGRIEDAKKQFPSISTNLIDYVSSKDPSGNNKYLRWILKQLRLKLLNEVPQSTYELNTITKQIVNKIISKVTEYDELLPYYQSNVLDADSLTPKIIKNPKDINNYDSIELLGLFNDMIRPIASEKKDSANHLKTTDVIYDGDDYLVVHIRTYPEMKYYALNTHWGGSEKEFYAYRNSYYIFIVVSKDENVLRKYLVMINKNLNVGGYIKIQNADNRSINMGELNDVDPRLNDMVRLIEMWKETNQERSAASIKLDVPELYVLTKYLNDDNLKHYKENSMNLIPSFTYNNGQITEIYYVGNLKQVETLAYSTYIKQIEQHPKLILRYTEELPLFLKMSGGLLKKVYDYLGFNDLFFNPDKIKTYYPVPPIKLKSAQISDNNGDLARLKQLDVDIENYNTQIKASQKSLKQQIHQIEKATETLAELQKRYDTLKIRAEQVKNDATKYDEINLRILEYERIINFTNKDLTNHTSAKETIEAQINQYQEKANIASDEYTDIINQLDATYSDKANYEYSNQQIKDAKEIVAKNVVSNPLSWIQKLQLKPEEILDIVDLMRLGDILARKLTQKVKSFGTYKLLSTNNENKINYYIFIDETNSNTKRK